MSTINHATIDLVDHRGRKYVTADERKRFLAAVRAHPKSSVQTLARTLALTGWRESEALAPTGARSRSPRIWCRRSASYTASEPPTRAPAAHHPPKRRAAGRRAHARRPHPRTPCVPPRPPARVRCRRGARVRGPLDHRGRCGGARGRRPGVELRRSRIIRLRARPAPGYPPARGAMGSVAALGRNDPPRARPTGARRRRR